MERCKSARALIGAIRWNWIGVALSLVIIGISIRILYYTLGELDVGRIVRAFWAMPGERLAVAAGAIVGAYATLTCYDLFALRTIGARHVPYRIAAMASFTSYAIGHNIGATVFSGGVIRYRIYSHWGLNVIDVAKLAFVTGLTFWLGNLTALGLGMAGFPDAVSAVDGLPPWINRALGLGGLALVAGYIAYVWRVPRIFGRDGWEVRLPGGPLTFLQVLIGVADLTFCSAAMYALLPDTPPIGFFTLLVAFVAATLLGFASHAPGSVGVFDAMMLLALPQFAKEELIAGLLMFRLIYFIAPFTIALMVMGVRETWLLATKAAPGEWPGRAPGSSARSRAQ